MTERVESPWTLFGPLSGGLAGPAPVLRAAHEYCIGNATAGLFAGDSLAAHIRLLPGASARLSSPAATYAFTMDRGEAVQHIRIEIEDGAELDYSPRPLIPFAGSSLVQATEFSLTGSASLRAFETLVLGRIDHGEVAAMRRLTSTLSIEIDGELVLCDALRIDTGRTSPGTLLRAFCGRPALGAYCAAGRLALRWRLERERLREEAARLREAGVLIGVSRPHARLVVARAVGPYPEVVESAIVALERKALQSADE